MIDPDIELMLINNCRESFWNAICQTYFWNKKKLKKKENQKKKNRQTQPGRWHSTVYLLKKKEYKQSNDNTGE